MNAASWRALVRSTARGIRGQNRAPMFRTTKKPSSEPVPAGSTAAKANESWLDEFVEPPAVYTVAGGGKPADILDALGHYADDFAFTQAPGGTSTQSAPTSSQSALTPLQSAPTPPQSAPTPSQSAPTPMPEPTTTEDATAAPAKKPGRGDSTAQNAEWSDMSKASTSMAERERLDIEWIGDPSQKLHKHVRESIDASYSDEKHHRPQQKQVDATLKQFDRDSATRLDGARDEIAEQFGLVRNAKTRRYSRQDLATIEQDPRFLQEKAELAKQREATAEKARADYRGAVDTTDIKQSVANPDSATISLDEGKMRSRTNFMAWATYLMGDPEKVKQHFRSIRGAAGDGHMLLTDNTAKRFEAAKAQFEKENPGYTLPTTGVAHSMRDLHEQRNGLGMLGHALGLAVDYSAYDNPNLRGEKGEQAGLNAYMLKRFGGGRSKMAIDEDEVEQLGKETVAGKSTAKGKETSAAAMQQFNELAQTSDRFKRSLNPEQMATLRKARNEYFKHLPDEQKLDAIKKQLAKNSKRMDQAKRTALSDEAKELEKKLAPWRARVKSDLNAGFGSWTTELQGELGVDQAVVALNQVTADRYSADAKGFGKLSRNEVDAYAKTHGMAAREDFKQSKQAATYEAQIKAEIAKRQKQAKEKVDYTTKSTLVKQKLIEKLHDPRRVFGKGIQKTDQTWDTKREVSEVSVMQLLEHGFVKNDAMPTLAIDPATGRPIDPTTGKPTNAKKSVFNAQTVEMLVRYGFAPGSNFGDTMHFDYIQGYSEAVQGGRRGENMNELRFSPEGKFIPPPDKDSKKAKKAKKAQP
ncbi:MAG: hypothetical protein ACTHU0_27080 [Kofleriaceae bacterium]